MVLLSVFGIFIEVSMSSTIAEINLLDRIENGSFVSEAEITSNDDRQATIGGLYIVVSAATVIAFCMWIHQASKNLVALGVHHQRFSPGWAVGWWFVPVMCLFRPYQVMKEIWRGSYPDIGIGDQAAWRNVPVSSLLGWWWAAWLLHGWVGSVGIKLFIRGETVSQVITADWLFVVGDVIAIMASILVFALVWQITSNQEKRHNSLESVGRPPADPGSLNDNSGVGLPHSLTFITLIIAALALVVFAYPEEAVPPPSPTATPDPFPNLRHIEAKQYMLELINAERIKAGLAPVVLGDNDAAQLHAEAALEGCFWSHWGIDGLKPYMRYSLAGGYQSNAENIIGLDHCIKWREGREGYASIVSIEQEIREAMAGWLDSPGHRRNILDRWHKKVNIGLAWDRYNSRIVQHFEGDYVEYDRLPALEDGLLVLSGRLKNGVRLEESSDLGVQIYYDRPPYGLTRGQVARTYCYGSGRLIASLRGPPGANWSWAEDEFTTTYQPCPNPYYVPADAPAPRSYDEALEFGQAAYDASQALEEKSITGQWIDASKWDVGDDAFSVTADLSELLREYRAGVYSLIVWGGIGGEKVIVSEYSIFHGVSPPDGYTGGAPGPP